MKLWYHTRKCLFWVVVMGLYWPLPSAHLHIFIKLNVLSIKTYKVFLVSFQDILTVGEGALVDEALRCAYQIDTGILQDKEHSRRHMFYNSEKHTTWEAHCKTIYILAWGRGSVKTSSGSIWFLWSTYCWMDVQTKTPSQYWQKTLCFGLGSCSLPLFLCILSGLELHQVYRYTDIMITVLKHCYTGLACQ